MRLVAGVGTVVLAFLLVPVGVGAAPGAPSPQTYYERRVEGLAADGWEGLLEDLGGRATTALAAVGADRSVLAELPPLPAAAGRLLGDLPAIAVIAETEDTDDGEDQDHAPEPAAEPVSASQTVDVTGDGVDDVWVTRLGYDGHGEAMLVGGAFGEVVWSRTDLWHGRTPRSVGDLDGDGVVDLVFGTVEFVDVIDIHEEGDGSERVGFEVLAETSVEVVSGATGERLWSQVDEERLGLALYVTRSATEWWFGIEIWVDNALVAPRVLPRTGPAEQIVAQRVDQHVAAEIGGRGVYVWDTGAPLSGVTATDRARLLFEGATHAELVDAASGTLVRSRQLDRGAHVGFFDVVSAGGEPVVLWTVYTVPGQHIECALVACIDELEPNNAVRVQGETADGSPSWEVAVTDRYDVTVRPSADLDGDGADELLVIDAAPAGDTYETTAAAFSAETGNQHWSTALGPSTWASVLHIQPWTTTGSLVVLYEWIDGSRQFGTRIYRLDGADGSALDTSTHMVEFRDPPPPVNLFDEPYVRGTLSMIVLTIGGDSDGDGFDDVLVSLSQTRWWSDDRPPTHWGRWIVESGRSGRPIHAFSHEEPRRAVTGWADTSGDGLAEFLEHITATGTRVLRAGADASPIWNLPEEVVLSPVTDVNGDGVADILAVHRAAPGGPTVSVLDGPTRNVVWSLTVTP